jgi:hypothetical protein
MANVAFKQYPNGYRVVSVLGSNAPVSEDQEVVTIFNLARSNPELLKDWNFKDRVFRTAVRLMGTGREWFRVQSVNDALGTAEKEFLVDCLRFMQTGKRPFMIQSRTAFFNPPAVKTPSGLLIQPKQPAPSVNMADLAKNLSNTRSNLIQEWVAWSGGLVDLITSLYVIFGPTASLPQKG